MISDVSTLPCNAPYVRRIYYPELDGLGHREDIAISDSIDDICQNIHRRWLSNNPTWLHLQSILFISQLRNNLCLPLLSS